MEKTYTIAIKAMVQQVVSPITDEAAAAVAKWFAKRFNVLVSEDEESVEFRDTEALGFVPTTSEISYVVNLIDEGKGIEEMTVSRLSKMGLEGDYENALKSLNDYWDKVLQKPYNKKSEEKRKEESEELKRRSQRVYKLRASADACDPDLAELRQEWMGKHPTTKDFSRYAEVMGLKADSVEALHARMLTPACVVSKFLRYENQESDILVEGDLWDREPNRDKWFDTDVRGIDGRAKQQNKSNPENEVGELTRKLCRQFSWLVDPDTSDLEDIGIELMARYDALFSSDMIKQRIKYALGHDDDALYEKLMMTPDRVREAAEQEKERNKWRDSVAKGYIPSFNFDLYLCGFGRQKDISWSKMGGVFKSAWGARLKLECVKLTDEEVELCKKVQVYDDSNDHNGISTAISYKGAKHKMLKGYKLRKIKGCDTWPETFLNWNRTLVDLCLHQNLQFCAQVVKLEDKIFPDDPYDYNKAWFTALQESIGKAKDILANAAEKMVVSHDYSPMDDIYQNEGEEIAIEVLRAIRPLAMAAAVEQENYVNDRQVLHYVESDDEFCDF